VNTETCTHRHEAPTTALEALHESQAGAHRHKCCVCAYQEGERLGALSRPQPSGKKERCHEGRTLSIRIINALPESQAGTGRHMCAICAFYAGFRSTRRKPDHQKPTFKGFSGGSQKYQQSARLALPLLVAQARARNTITYGQLARELNMPNHRNLNYVLGAIGREIKELGREWKEEIPPLNCIVINKHDRLPQRGIEFYMPPEEFERLSQTRQQEILHHLYQDIWDYQRWDEVLLHFDLEPLIPAKSKHLQEISKKAKYGRAGGEGEDHRRLKEYIRANPSALRLPKSLDGRTEHCFPSSDEIDVMFDGGPTWIGVEVKGARSDSADIMRGIFQCVKYKALIEATQRYAQVEIDCRVLLALGSTLPKELNDLIGLFNIELFENIEVPSDFKC
jgi:hypothetical protein